MSSQISSDLTYVVKRVPELSDKEIQDWENLRLADPVYSTALLTFEFAKAIASKRDDVRVVLIKSGALPVGFFCGHVRPGGLVRPVGAPFDDYSGPIVAAGYNLELAKVLEALGCHSYRASASVTPIETVVDTKVSNPGLSYVVQLADQTAADYLASRFKENPKRHKNFRRLSRKMEKDFTQVELRFGAPSKESLKQLFDWKSAQFQRSGLVDILSTSFSREALDAFVELPFSEASQFGGYSTEIWVDGKFIAGHFGVRAKCDFHPWISAYDPGFSESAPGIVLLYRAIEKMDEMGLKTYDLSGGHDHYKKYFAQPKRKIADFQVSRKTLMGNLQATSFNFWNMFGTTDETSIALRMKRRFDHIATCEPNSARRLKEVGIAFRKRGKTHVE
ncbi:GNAT family N-acetyltransferase [Hirschia litorea]|uniref:GNAT family N-acetyltransferase n=1 Tax=Hirschia litorea TaxID=1199156 RepID=A0ABW2IIE7_9PROT